MYSKAGDFIRGNFFFVFYFSLFYLLNLAEEILSDLITSLPTTLNPHHIDPTAFSILMTGYNLHQQPEKTLITSNRVQNPDAISYLLSFQACSQLKDLEQGKRLAEKLAKSKINLRKEIKLQTALFDVSQ
jgi:hypothetical protein